MNRAPTLLKASFTMALGFVGQNVYTAVMEWLSGSTDGNTPTVSARLLEMGWAFFVLIVLSAYTANLAA